MPCDHEAHPGCPIAGPQQEFRARIAAQIRLAETFLHENRSTDEEKASLAGHRLGAFAGGRINAGRFAGLLTAGHRTDPTTLARVDEAAAMLITLSERIEDLTKIDVAPRESLHAAVARALREIGYVFGAARIIELARTERLVESEHGRYLRGLPFAMWSPAERAVTPAIRVRVRGEDLQVAGLADFLDGGLKLVLKVDGVCPPAALARLATPGVYVAQAASRAELDDFMTFDGPAVAAMVPDGAALFTHDPRRGEHTWQRFCVTAMPRAPRRALGGMSPFQQKEDLALLAELSSEPTFPAPEKGAEDALPDPTDQLASWLLGQAGLNQPGPNQQRDGQQQLGGAPPA